MPSEAFWALAERYLKVCGVENLLDHNGKVLQEHIAVIPIAREYGHDGIHLNPKKTRLKTSDNEADYDLEGIRIELGGGHYSGKDQKAIIEFRCPPKKKDTEKERRDDDEDKEGDDDKDDEKDGDKEGDDKKEDEHKHPDWEKAASSSDGKGGTLKFEKYLTDDSKVSTLRLTWTTPHACEDASEGGDSSDEQRSGGWGFFSWFFFLLFIGGLIYFVFFAWINYSRYGAQGWDLVPHSDVLRDLPYIFGDWTRKVVGTFSGSGGTRGGHSAV